jgi:hypothetical protein
MLHVVMVNFVLPSLEDNTAYYVKQPMGIINQMYGIKQNLIYCYDEINSHCHENLFAMLSTSTTCEGVIP